jgi:hypothetical protein
MNHQKVRTVLVDLCNMKLFLTFDKWAFTKKACFEGLFFRIFIDNQLFMSINLKNGVKT